MENDPGRVFGFAFNKAEIREDRISEWLEWSTFSVNEALQFHAPNAVFSGLFRQQLAWSWMGQVCVFAGKRIHIDPHAVLHEIAHLEDPSKITATGPAKALEGDLAGFRRKHFYQPSFMLANLLRELETGGVFDELFHKYAKPRIEKQTGNKFDDGYVLDEVAINSLAYAVVVDAYERRAGAKSAKSKTRLTGEWIIFVPYQGRNHYLTLAMHAEAKLPPPDPIRVRLESMISEFAFLSTLLERKDVKE